LSLKKPIRKKKGKKTETQKKKRTIHENTKKKKKKGYKTIHKCHWRLQTLGLSTPKRTKTNSNLLTLSNACRCSPNACGRRPDPPTGAGKRPTWELDHALERDRLGC
jgi:hypothetical protein